MTQMLYLSDGDFKITIINMLKGSSGKDGQYAWTDGKFQQRDRKYKGQMQMLYIKYSIRDEFLWWAYC